jgi:hypothetical protein
MRYEVVLTERAKQQLDAASAWYDGNAPEIANDWYNGFLDALTSLEINPDQHSIARESNEFVTQIRQLLFGLGKRKTHRAVFSIHRDRVVVRAIRHLSQRDLERDDLLP